ncbi:MAG: tripartite tricarboxylate transporter TctB family protein [Pseudomonadota bacterium]
MSDPATPQHRPGNVIFAALFFLAAIFLLSQLGEQTKFSAKTIWSKKTFAQPAFWPAVGVGGMALFGLMNLVQSWLRRTRGEGVEAAFWLRPFEYLAWFMGYVFTVPVIGYLPATLIFAVALGWRAGYRTRRMLGLAALTGAGIVLVFKTALSVKIPGGAVYEYLPEAIRNFAIANL